MNIEERVRELEDKYKRYLLKKYFKFLFIFAILIACMLISFFMVQDFYKQKALALEALEYKKTLNWQITQAQIANEKNKILQERLSKDESKDELEEELEEELKTQIDIYSKILNISDLKRSFYQNPSYQKAMNLATQYYENKDYEKSIFWSLKANDIDRKNSDSWVLFAKAKQALGKDEEAKQALDTYVSYYGLIEFDKEIDD
ncbi:transformation system protein [Campylobacter coli]|nr:transformation system protein [Campylobacter coli]EAK5740523.1 transformation system protein [Campylobacter coli]EIZ8405760.1 transformation system protein [Campylobacter coli]EKJ1189528.1 transformation system protein [Campylobacter coli]EKK5615550.1 transformation system protein [Campylobacter coli]